MIINLILLSSNMILLLLQCAMDVLSQELIAAEIYYTFSLLMYRHDLLYLFIADVPARFIIPFHC